MTVHGANVVMEWRKPTITVVDTSDGIIDAAQSGDQIDHVA